MRTLIVLRGSRGSGRRDFIERRDLAPWHIDEASMDALLVEPCPDFSGAMSFDHHRRARARNLFRDLLVRKFARGAFVVITPADRGDVEDGEGMTEGDRTIAMVARAAARFRYRIIVIDFGRLPDERVRRLKARLEVSDHDWIAASAAPANLLDLAEPPVIDISNYSGVVAIGDVHGCDRTLEAMLGAGGFRDDVAYIFLGDYINKGPRSAEVLRLLKGAAAALPNIHLLTGNHELLLESWALDGPSRRSAHAFTAQESFEASDYSRAEAHAFLPHLIDAARFRWGDMEMLATHGGLASPPERLGVIASHDLIRGAGFAEFDVDAAWGQGVARGMAPPHQLVQIHGHRNPEGRPIQAAPGSFNLEGGVEAGGALRAVAFQRRRDGLRIQPIQRRSMDMPSRSGCAGGKQP